MKALLSMKAWKLGTHRESNPIVLTLHLAQPQMLEKTIYSIYY